MPASPPRTRWCWSTTATRPARNCSTWRGASPARCSERFGVALEPEPRVDRRDAGERDVASAAAIRILRAALLMLGSTVFFGLMAVAIRLASETLHTFEIAFFRNFFGVDRRPAAAAAGTAPACCARTQLPRYFIRCVIGVRVDVLRLLGDRPPAAGAGGVAVVLDAAVRHHRRGAVPAASTCARDAGPRWSLGFIGVLVIVRPGTARASPPARWSRCRRRCSAASSRSRSSSCRAPSRPTASCCARRCCGCRCRWCRRCSCGNGRRASPGCGWPLPACSAPAATCCGRARSSSATSRR